jgi:hypothetical protein
MSGLAITSRKVTLEYEESDGYLRIMVAREGVEPPTPAFSGLDSRVFTMTWNARTTP